MKGWSRLKETQEIQFKQWYKNIYLKKSVNYRNEIEDREEDSNEVEEAKKWISERK